MTTQDILHILQADIHSVVFATLDEQGLPQTCVIDLMLSDEGGLYFLTARGTAPVSDGISLLSLLRRPQVRYEDLRAFDPAFPGLPAQVAEAVEIGVKYEGYIRRQLQEVEDFRKMEDRRLPPDLDYQAIQGLRLEAREKLQAVRPLNLGQAGRISGVSPADIAALMIYLERG